MKLPHEITSEQIEQSIAKDFKITNRLWRVFIVLTLIVFILQAIALYIVLAY